MATVQATSREADALLLVAASLVLGAFALVAPWEVAVATLGCAVVALHRVRRAWLLRVVVVACVLAGATRAAHRVRAFEAARETGPPSSCDGNAVVADAPVRTHGTMRWTADVRGACDGRAWSGRATLFGGPDDLARGDVVDITAHLGVPQRLWNETSDPRPADARRGVTRSGGIIDARVLRGGRGVLAWIDRARAHVRRRIDATFSADAAPMARALVLGENDLADGDDAAFRASGLAHLLAVSGMHLVLVVLGAVAAMRAALVRVEAIAARVDAERIAAAAGIPIAWAYAVFAGAGGSTVRAAWMLTVALAARALGRRTDGVRAMALSMVAMWIGDPLVAFDLSFALSAAATLGLLVGAKPLGDALVARAPSIAAAAWIARSIATSIAASLPCVPILARIAPSVPALGVIANVIAVPIGEMLALPLCLAHAVLAPFPLAERGCAVAASGALIAVRAIARACAAASWTSLEIPPPSAWQLAVAAVAAMGAWRHRGDARRAYVVAGAAAVLLLELRVRAEGAPRGVLRATFLDVGQGDAAIVDLPDGEAMIIDGGGIVGSPIDIGARVVAPALRLRRRRDLAAVILSHPHPDHFGGLATGLATTRFGALWDTGQGEHEGVGGAYAALLASARTRASILRPDTLCGARAIGGARVEVLAPCPAPESDLGPNDNSFVLRISYGARALLFVGDAEREEESALLASGATLRADVLKVGHHGSRTSSSPAFVAAVAPREAIVSVGVRNRFGHPHPATLATLAHAGARVWRTDRDGAVTVTTDGTCLDVRASAR